MKLKHYGLMALLGLLSFSCSDDKEQFSGSDGQGQIQASFGADYKVINPKNADGTEPTEIETVSPDVSEFSVHLSKKDGSYDKTWDSVSDFPVDTKFTTGTYTMEIWYGDIAEEGFEKPYYYGSSTFDVIDEEKATPAIEAKLGNTMVSLSYTEAFKNYFTSYSAEVMTAGGSTIEFENEETRPVYVKPGKVSFQLQLVKTNGTELTLVPAAIDNAEACTHYRVTFDVNGGEVGNAVLSVTFDDATVQEPIEVALSDELMTTSAPVITPKGFSNDTPINIIEGDEATAKVAIVAQAGIKSVILNTSSEYLVGKGWAQEMDLMNVTAEQKALLEQSGVSSIGLWNNPDKMAVIDFSGVIPKLSPVNGNSTHTFTVQVKDIYGRLAETAAVLTVNAPSVVLNMSEVQKSEAGSLEGKFLLTYNGNMDNLSFKAQNDYGVYVDAPIKASVNNNDGTYNVTVTIPDNEKTTVVQGYYKGEAKGEPVTINIGMAYTLSSNAYDVWATKATVSVNSKFSNTRNRVLNNAVVYLNGETTSAYTIDNSKSAFQFTGLAAGTAYTVKTVALDDEGLEVVAETSFTTEATAQVKNNTMEEWYNVKVYSKKTLWVGTDCYEYFPKASESAENYWSTRNPMTTSQRSGASCYYTCYSGTQNTTGVSGNAARIATIGWGEGNTFTNSMTGVYIYRQSAGMLFMGDYSYASGSDKHYNGTETITYGRPFTSRPSQLTFQYTYAPIENESFKAYIVLENRDNGVVEIGRGEMISGTSVSSFTKAEVNINYSRTDLKATHAYIVFLSSTADSPAVTPVKGDKGTLAGYTDSIYQGSVLVVDDIVLNY